MANLHLTVAGFGSSTEQTMPAAVELRGIHKTYDHFVAVDHLSLQIGEGSVYGLLGSQRRGKDIHDSHDDRHHHSR